MKAALGQGHGRLEGGRRLGRVGIKKPAEVAGYGVEQKLLVVAAIPTLFEGSTEAGRARRF